MSIIHQLASSSGRRDEILNTALAETIVSTGDASAIAELVANLSNKNKNIQSDCIKVLYETGERKPALISGYSSVFIKLLNNTNNRLVWGAMTALDCIASVNPHAIHDHITTILKTADKGSVITKDHAVNILIKLAAVQAYKADSLALLLEQFKSCAINQLPMYAERASAVVGKDCQASFIAVLSSRMGDTDKESKRKRLEKVIRQWLSSYK